MVGGGRGGPRRGILGPAGPAIPRRRGEAGQGGRRGFADPPVPGGARWCPVVPGGASRWPPVAAATAATWTRARHPRPLHCTPHWVASSSPMSVTD